ncbi:hypothetical protein [Porphyromonas loveana]|uniref:Uncharacterized protein n=1 Tax=Porphyromonas loveana TaxID=1884669 RepID=A0A2U1FAZ7_9PORP|nr:hypothetical protein [Porphyromonas loveana]PVZ09309.1 hypothetical protein C7382_10951 [Porphyromonas loveana]
MNHHSNNRTHTTPLQRIALLLRMEWGTNGRNTLLFLLAMLGVLVAITLLIHLQDSFGVSTTSANHVFLWMLTFGSMAFYVFRIVQARVNNSDTVSYPILPATATEKFIVILIEGVLALMAAIVVNQLAYTIEVLLYPGILETSSSFLVVHRTASGYEWLALDPFFVNRAVTIGFLGFIAMGIFFAVRMKKLISATVGVLLTFGLQTIAIVNIAPLAIHLPLTEVITGCVGLVFFVLSFITLQRRQL